MLQDDSCVLQDDRSVLQDDSCVLQDDRSVLQDDSWQIAESYAHLNKIRVKSVKGILKIKCFKYAFKPLKVVGR